MRIHTPAAPEFRAPDAPVGVEVTTHGALAPDIRDYAAQKVRVAARHCTRPILRAQVRIIRYPDPALPRPYVTHATLNVNGRLVRVHAAAENARDAVDALGHVLRRALVDRERTAGDRRRRADRHTVVGSFTYRPPEEREIIQRPTYAARICSVDEAIEDLDALDDAFHLFTDADTGVDTVVYHGGPTGYRLIQRRRRPLTSAPVAAVSVVEQPAPELTVAEAAERLGLSGQPFLFFSDPETGRGAVLHVRDDGHYGLITVA